MDRGKWIILGGVAALVVAWLYAPLKLSEDQGESFDPGPIPATRTDEEETVSWVEAYIYEPHPILFAEWVAIILVTGGLYFVFRIKREIMDEKRRES